MELKIGEKITGLRKAKGMTQEQLAEALGVSAPAVSKWETDSSYPDITLLCPLARALGTDVDSLLAFEETLSEESLRAYMAEVMGLVRSGDVAGAEEMLDRLLHTYPSSVPLKCSATAALTFFEMSAPECQAEDRERWQNRKERLCQAIYDSGNSAYRMAAISMLVSLLLAKEDLEKAEGLLKETLTEPHDFTMLWVQLYEKKGEKEKALETVQKRLYSLAGEIQTCLTCMMGEQMELDEERVLKICEISQKLDEIFQVGSSMRPGLFAEVFLRFGKAQKALEYLEELTENLEGEMAPPNPILFAPAVAPEPERRKPGRELRLVLLQGLQRDACFEEIRGEERFQKLLQRMERGLEQREEKR